MHHTFQMHKDCVFVNVYTMFLTKAMCGEWGFCFATLVFLYQIRYGELCNLSGIGINFQNSGVVINTLCFVTPRAPDPQDM